ncbi:hypothetical protein T484DRAFT_1988961, partial [Baffinella frigidus]
MQPPLPNLPRIARGSRRVRRAVLLHCLPSTLRQHRVRCMPPPALRFGGKRVLLPPAPLRREGLRVCTSPHRRIVVLRPSARLLPRDPWRNIPRCRGDSPRPLASPLALRSEVPWARDPCSAVALQQPTHVPEKRCPSASIDQFTGRGEFDSCVDEGTRCVGVSRAKANR